MSHLRAILSSSATGQPSEDSHSFQGEDEDEEENGGSRQKSPPLTKLWPHTTRAAESHELSGGWLVNEGVDRKDRNGKQKRHFQAFLGTFAIPLYI